MTVAELLSKLENVDQDAEVRLVLRQRAPIQCRVGRIEEYMEDDGNVVYIGLGDDIGYLSGDAYEQFKSR